MTGVWDFLVFVSCCIFVLLIFAIILGAFAATIYVAVWAVVMALKAAGVTIDIGAIAIQFMR